MDIDILPKVTDIKELKGKKVLLRMSLNVSVKNKKVVDDFRLQSGMKTLEYLHQKGAKVIIIGHIGRDKAESLFYVSSYLEQFFPITFIENIMNNDVSNTVDEMRDGDILMFENLRRHDGETNNDDTFSQYLAHFADYFVNDDFSTGHRKHASMVGIPKYIPGYLGFQFIEEVENLSKVFEPKHPFVFILGGAKVETKEPLLLKFLGKADTIFIGGVLANDFLKAQGYCVGKSVVSGNEAPVAIARRDGVLLPKDVVVLRDGQTLEVVPSKVKEGDIIYDIGSSSVKELCDKISKAKFVLWNGPLGYCEKGFCESTEKVAELIANTDIESILGGGDTLAAIDDSFYEKFSFVSTAGGAMLEFLAEETLPAIEVLTADKS